MAKREKPLHIDMSFEEALRRLAQTDPAEIIDEVEKVRERQKEIRDGVKKTKESIKRGA
jgi:hypothetical protein